jgi:long-chain acyl-CoA synthetase
MNRPDADLLPDALRKRARLRPRDLALAEGSQHFSYQELGASVRELERRLAGVGVEKGDRVCLLGENTLEWVVAFLAILGRGAIAVPLNTRLSRSELHRQIALSDPRLTLASQRLLRKAEWLGTNGRRVHVLEPSFANSIWEAQGAPVKPLALSPASAAVISFTSGTTGDPKGAVIAHDALIHSATAYVQEFETGRDDTTLVLVPLFHNTGFVDQLTQMLLVGGSLELLREFSVDAALDALERHPASYLIAVPSIYRLFMMRPRGDAAFRACRVAAYGGSPMPQSWIEELQSRWPQLRPFNVYGLTEFTSVSHVLPPELLPEHGDTVGRPVSGVAHRVVDEREQSLQAGQVGEVQLAGPTRMSGYWRDEGATTRAFSEGWLRTGDLGSIATDGLLTIEGRSADVINRGGEKVHATHVESALGHVPVVGEAAVVGAPHPVFQEQVIACLVVRDSQRFDKGAVLAHLAEWVPDFALPERFLLLGELPRNAAGKVDRAQLRELASAAVDGERR